MKLKQQFAVLTAVVALLIAISCGVGYYMASSMLTDSIEHQLTAIVKGEGDSVDSWVANKAAMLNGTAAVLSKQPAEVIGSTASVPFLATASADKKYFGYYQWLGKRQCLQLLRWRSFRPGF